MCDDFADTLNYSIMARRRHGHVRDSKELETDSTSTKSKNGPTQGNAKNSREPKGKGQGGGSGSVLIVMATITMVMCVTGGVLYLNKDMQDLVYSTLREYTANEPASAETADAPVMSDDVEEIITEPNTNNDVKMDAGDKKVPDMSHKAASKEETTPGGKNKKKQSASTSSNQKTKDGAQKKGDKSKKVYSKASITNVADNRIRKELDEADDILTKGDYGTAIDKYNFIIKRYPNSPRGHHGKAEALDKMAEKQRSNAILEESIQSFQKVLDLPDVPEELVILAGRRAADRMNFRGWSKKAAKVLRQLADMFPKNITLKNELGVSYLMSGKSKEAKVVFEEVVHMDPENGYALVHLGFILKTSDNAPEKSIPLLKAGIESRAPGTDDGRFYFHLGDALQRVGKKEEAYDIYKEGAEHGHFKSIYQRSLYNVDHLTGHPWWTVEQTGYQKYMKMLEENWQTIRDEGLAQMDKKSGAFLPEDENLRETGDWKQFTLYQRGEKSSKNCAKVPKTCALIDQIPAAKDCKRGQVKYSVMHPGVHVWPHCGPTNCRIRAHLGLVVPDGPRISVAGKEGKWKEGKFIIFDDSFEHEVWHEGNSVRLVLIVDFWHPELTDKEKRTLSPI